MLVAENVDSARAGESEAQDRHISVGKVEVAELSVDTLTIADTAVGDRDLHDQGILADSQPA